MKNLRNYLITTALALTAGCMTPTPVNNQRILLNEQIYSGLTRTARGQYFVQTSEDNVRYSAKLARGIKRESDVQKRFYPIEELTDNSGTPVISVNLKMDNPQMLEELRTGKKTLEEFLGKSVYIYGLGKVVPINYGNKKIFLVNDRNTELHWNRDGKAVLYGRFFQIGEELNQIQFNEITNPVPPTLPKPAEKSADKPVILNAIPVEQTEKSK